jgi:hypothetical protein
MKKKFLAIEAVLCSLPCILLVMGGLPIMLVAAFRSLSYSSGDAAWCFLFVSGVILALSQYVVLSLRTVEQKRYRFGFAFWIAAAFALCGLWWMGRAFGLTAAATTIGPILVATLHFIALQFLCRRYPGSH